MIIDSVKLIKDLSNSNGVSGFEDEVVELIKSRTSNFFKTNEDSTRNVYIYRKKHSGTKPIIMLDAHSDEVGFMVKSIKKNGMIRFVDIGGWFSQNVSAHKVRIKNSVENYITGIVSSKPPHFMTQKEKDTVIYTKDMFIDVGASSKEEVEEIYKIEPGAPIIPDVDFSYNKNTKVMMGKAFDNRLGCAAVIDTLYNLENEPLEVDIVGAISSQEEVGLRGAAITSNVVKPNICIVFEGTPADDTFRDNYDAQACLNKGPQIRHLDNSMIANPRLVKLVRDLSKERSIPFQDAVRIGGGTNAGEIHVSNAGVPTIVIGIPVRYAHTHYCFSSFNDYHNTVKLAVEFIKSLNDKIISSL